MPADVRTASEGHKRALELALGALRAAGAAVNVAAADFEDLSLEGLAHSSELSHHALALDEYLASHLSSGLTRDGVLGASFHRGVEAFFTDASAWTPPGTTRDAARAAGQRARRTARDSRRRATRWRRRTRATLRCTRVT